MWFSFDRLKRLLARHTAAVSGLTHVALAVSAPERSLEFYRDVIGVDGQVRAEAYGFVISTRNRVAFTLFRGKPPTSAGDFHIGVSLPDAEAVRQARERFRSMGLVEHEWCDEPGYTSVKVVDPDGYVVEVAWDLDHGSEQ
jgi:catechol 2,3-dioxygenase-like lactoylglutathione lyase family enzyme